MAFRKVNNVIALILMLLLMSMLGCSGKSSAPTPAAKSVGRIILSEDKQVVGDVGDQAESSVAYDPTTQTFLTVFTHVNSTLNITEIRGVVCAGYPKAAPAYQSLTDLNSTPGVACGNTFAISDQSVSYLTSPGNKTQPKVAFDIYTKKYLVVWTDSRHGTYSQIYGQYIETDTTFNTDFSTLNGILLQSNGTTNGMQNFAISPHVDGVYISQSQPDLIFNSVLQKFVLTWVDTSTFDNNRIKGVSVIQKPKWKAGDSFTISSVDSSDLNKIKLDRSSGIGSLTVNTDYSIVANGAQSATFTVLSNSILVDTPDQLKVTYTPTSGIGSTSNILPKWHIGDTVPIPAPSDRLPDDKVYLIMDAGIYNGGQIPVTGQNLPNGSSIATATSVTFNSSTSAVGTSNSILVYRMVNNLVFESVQGGKCSNAVGPIVYVPTIMADNNLVRSAEVTSSGVVGNLKEVSELVSTGNGAVDTGSKINATWNSQFNESRPKIEFNRSTGENYIAWSGINKNINMDISWSLNIDQTSCSYGGAVFTANDTDGGKPKIKLRRNQGLGLVKDFSFGTGSSFYPAMAVDPNTNSLLISWEDDQSIIGQIIGLDSFLLKVPNNITISAKSSNPAVNDPRTSPVAAFDNVGQRFLVVWEDARNRSANLSGVDVYGQFIDPQGNLSGGNTIVTVANGNQLAPAIAFGDINYRKFFINWKDARNPSDANIYGQLHEYSLGPQLALYLRDNTTGDLSPLLNSAIDFGSTAIGSTVDKTLVLRNDGNGELIINKITGVNGTPSGPDLPYSIISPKPVTINPGTSSNLDLRFAPFASGSYADPSKNFGIVIESNGGKAVLYFSGSGTGNIPLSISSTVLPDASQNALYSFALQGVGGVYPYTWSISGMPPSFVASRDFNPTTGVISWSPQNGDININPYTVIVTLQDNNSPKGQVSRQMLLRVGSVSITTEKLLTWGVGRPYESANQILEATLNGVSSTAFTWSISKGTLPSGIGFSPTVPGKLVGTTTESGTFTFTVKAVSNANSSVFAERQFTLTINPKPTILTTSLPVGIIGKNYNFAITMSGGTAPFEWTSSAMPAGLTFSSGVIFGIPTSSGTQNVTVKLTDATGATAEFVSSGLPISLPLKINDTLDIKTPTTDPGAPPNGTAGAFYSFTFTSQGGIAPYTWSVVNSTLPQGLLLIPGSGGLSGTLPENSAGSYSFNVQLQDSSGSIVTKTYDLLVSPPLKISTSSLPSWTVNSGNYKQELVATGGASPYSWSWRGNDIQTTSQSGTVITPGPMPDGLSLISETTAGVTRWYVNGNPTKAGSYQMLVKVTDKNNASSSAVLNLQVNSDLTISTTLLPSGSDGVLYNSQILTTGGTAPFNWSVSAGALPPGLTLDPLSGLISGLPTTGISASKTYDFTVKLEESVSKLTRTKLMSITISPLLKIKTDATLPMAPLNAAYSHVIQAEGGRVPYTWAITGGALPTGLTLGSNTGVVSGTPTAPGKFDFILTVTDSDKNSVSKTMSVSTTNVPTAGNLLSIISSKLSSSQIGFPYSTTMAATGGTSPYSWTVINGTLPTGMSLDKATGIISGTPTAPGNFDFVIQVQDRDTSAATKAFSIVVLDPAVASGGLLFADSTGSTISDLSFGNVFINTPIKKTITILNLSANAVTLTPSVTAQSSFTAFGAQIVVPAATLSAPGSAKLDITFRPTVSGRSYSGVLTLTDKSSSATSQLPLSGVGVPVNVTLAAGTGLVTYIDSIPASTIVGRPAGFVPSKAAEFSVSGVPVNGDGTPGKVTVNVVFDSLPSNPVFYKLANGTWTQIFPTVSGNTISYEIVDNGPLDTNSEIGVIYDPVVVGTSTTVSGGDINTPPPASGGGGGGGCFIATAAYGSYLDPHVSVLRNFRDEVLMKSVPGKAFVKFYYKHSPPVAAYIADHAVLRLLMRLVLTPLIFAVKYPLVASIALVLASISFFARRLFRSKSEQVAGCISAME